MHDRSGDRCEGLELARLQTGAWLKVITVTDVIPAGGRGGQGVAWILRLVYWFKGQMPAPRDHQGWSRPSPVDDQLQQNSMGQLCELGVTRHVVIVL